MSRGWAWACVVLTIALTVVGQFLIKWQVLKAGPMPADTGGRLEFLLRLLMNPWVLSALAAAFLASISWMVAMTRLPLSEAYPLTALTFVCVVFGGAWLFLEPVSPMRVLGVALIVAGLVVGSRA